MAVNDGQGEIQKHRVVYYSKPLAHHFFWTQMKTTEHFRYDIRLPGQKVNPEVGRCYKPPHYDYI